MKKNLFLIVIFNLLSLNAFAQQNVEYSKVSILEKYESKWKHWGGDVETVWLAAVHEIIGNDSSLTLHIKVKNKDWVQKGVTTSAAYGSSFWGVGTSVQEVIENRVGHIILTRKEFEPLMAFINESFARSKQGGYLQETTWSIKIGDRFTASLVYDGRWYHVWTIDGTSFEIPSEQEIPMFKKLSSMGKIIH